jgi:hypothetical protein
MQLPVKAPCGTSESTGIRPDKYQSYQSVSIETGITGIGGPASAGLRYATGKSLHPIDCGLP